VSGQGEGSGCEGEGLGMVSCIEVSCAVRAPMWFVCNNALARLSVAVDGQSRRYGIDSLCKLEAEEATTYQKNA